MNSWILSIVGIVCLSVIVDVFIPEGQTNKYIKSIFSLLIVFVIVSPLPNLLKGDFNFQNILNNVNTDIDLNFISTVNSQKSDAIIKILEEDLNNNGIQTESINISYNAFQEEFEILMIYVDISNIESKDLNQIKNKIINTIQDNININKEQIIFNE